MRTVMNTREVIQAWLKQAQPHARNGSRRVSVYFKDTIIYSYGDHYPYSYGDHYPIARLDNGRAWVNRTRYSVSTSRHTGMVHSALDSANIPFLSVCNPVELNPIVELEYLCAQELLEVQRLKRALRTSFPFDYHFTHLRDLQGESRLAAEVFGLKYTCPWSMDDLHFIRHRTLRLRRNAKGRELGRKLRGETV